MFISIPNYLNVTYDFMYSGMYAIGVVTFLYVISLLVQSYKKWLKEKSQLINFQDCLEYISTETNLGINAPDDNRIKICIGGITQNIQDKKLTVFAIQRGRNLNHNKVDIASITNPEYSAESNSDSLSNMGGIRLKHYLVLKDKDNNVIYENFCFYKYQIEKLFPSIY